MSEMNRVKIDFSGLQGTVKCGHCSSTSTDICNQLGCGFLESGNGESEIDQLRQRAEEAEAELAEFKAFYSRASEEVNKELEELRAELKNLKEKSSK